MASSPMDPLWEGKRYKLYIARRGRRFTFPGIHLWTGKRHVRLIRFRKDKP